MLGDADSLALYQMFTKLIPNIAFPAHHACTPFIEQLLGTIRREYL